MRGKHWIVLTMVAILSLVVAACGPMPTPLPPTDTPTPVPPTDTPTPVPPTDTPVPTSTPTPIPPTDTPVPTPTPTPIPPTDTPTPVPPTDTPTPVPPTDTPVPTSTPTPPSPEALLEAALAALETEPYHFEMDIQMAVKEEGITIEMPMTLVGDFQPPDRVRATMSMSLLGITIESEMITIGETTYVKDPATGKWEVSTEQASPYSPEDFTGIDPADIEGLVLVGEEKLDGTPVYHLRGTVSTRDMGDAMAEVEGELQVHYWIGVKGGHLRRNVVKGQLSASDQEAVTVDMKVTTTYSRYGKPVAIEPP